MSGPKPERTSGLSRELAAELDAADLDTWGPDGITRQELLDRADAFQRREQLRQTATAIYARLLVHLASRAGDEELELQHLRRFYASCSVSAAQDLLDTLEAICPQK